MTRPKSAQRRKWSKLALDGCDNNSTAGDTKAAVNAPVKDDVAPNLVKLDADKAKLLFEELALDRVINAVGKTPTKPDRNMLRNDLLVCYGRYSIASGPGQSGFVKRQTDRLTSMRKHARKLAELLKADEADLGIISRVWPINSERPAQLFTQLVFLVEIIDAMKGMQGKPGDIVLRTKRHLGMSGSALQWLVNTLLPTVYREHFGKDAGISRNENGTLGGPYLRFVRQVLAELKIECSDETVASALNMAKS